MRLVTAVLVFLLAFVAVGYAQNADGVPIEIKNGKKLILTENSTHDEIQKALGKILKSEMPSILTAERIQYDFQAVEGQAPLTLCFDFDAHGKLTGLLIDAYMKDQNPTAQLLKQWLEKHVGEGKKVGAGLQWSHAGYLFLFTAGGSGEDSNYGFRITRVKK